MLETRKSTIFLILCGIFITSAVTAELIGSKLVYVGPYVMSIGILPWPIVFLVTDLINEFFGKESVRKLSFITAGLIAFCFAILLVAISIPAAKDVSAVSDSQFDGVFGQSMWIIVGSIIAFLVSQLIDVTLFHYLKNRTGNRMIWLRSTGSTVISQLFDSFIVLGIAFWLTGQITTEMYISSALTGYVVKLAIAIALTPLIYLGHGIVKNYIANDGQ